MNCLCFCNVHHATSNLFVSVWNFVKLKRMFGRLCVCAHIRAYISGNLTETNWKLLDFDYECECFLRKIHVILQTTKARCLFDCWRDPVSCKFTWSIVVNFLIFHHNWLNARFVYHLFLNISSFVLIIISFNLLRYFMNIFIYVMKMTTITTTKSY